MARTKAAKQPAPSPVAEAPKRVRITDAMVAQVGGDQWRAPAPMTRADIFRPKPPMPGVLPDGVAIAQDYGAGSPYAYASSGQYGEGMFFLGYPYLSELTQRPEYRRGSEIIAKEMTRKWLKLRAVGDQDKSERIKKLEDAMDKFDVQDLFRRAAEHDGFFGVAHLYVDTGDTDRPEELKTGLWLDPAKIGKGSLKGFRLAEPVWTYPGQYNSTDPLRPDFYVPQSWYVMGKELHRTRLLRFCAREVPDLLKPAYQFGGLSLSQIAKPYVDEFLRTRDSISDLIHSFSTMVLSTNMEDMLQPGSAAAAVNRAQMFNQFRDNRGLFMIDKEREEIANVTTPLSTLDQLGAQSQERMSAVLKIPTVVLLGIDPAGLNATAQGTIRTFYDWVHSCQSQLFDKNLRRVMDIIQLSEFGDIDADIVHDWEPLWQLDEAALAAVQKTKADTHAVYMDAGVIAPEEVRESLAADAQSFYHGIDLSGPPPEPPEDPETVGAGGEAKGEGEAEEKDGV
jgi:phage-related protein (TIGR01555 family)